MKALVLAAALTAVHGCGSDGPVAGHAAPPVNLEEKPGDRLPIATVNGVPVYDDCARSQVATLQVSFDEAVRQCVDFELLAQAAAPFASNWDTHDAQRRELVRALIDQEFEPSADEPADVPAAWLRDNMWSIRDVRFRYQHPEYRVAAYALAKFQPIGPKRVLTPTHDAERRALAEEWDRSLSGRGPLSVEEFRRIVTEVAGDRPFDFNEAYDTPKRGRSVNEFADALFALSKPGDISGPTRSNYGYFIIYLKEILPAENRSFEEAVPELQRLVYERWRNVAFVQFVDQLLGKARIDEHEDRLELVRIDIPDEFELER